ncbi:hypothetical protein OAG62_02205 [bacterium]|nr:hypothetical protein [bacterium]
MHRFAIAAASLIAATASVLYATGCSESPDTLKLQAQISLLEKDVADLITERDRLASSLQELETSSNAASQKTLSNLNSWRSRAVRAEDRVKALESGTSNVNELFTDSPAPAAPGTSPPLLTPSLAAILLPAEGGSADVWYYEPIIPEPRIQPMVTQTIDTIDSSELARVPALSSMLDGGSRDVVWTTPVASISLTAIRRELEGQDSMTDPMRNQIPSNWHNRRPYFVDVVFERQAMGRNGEWGAAAMVEPVPGILSFREEIADLMANSGLDARFRQQVCLTLDDKVRKLEFMQPDFFRTVNDSFAEPTIFYERVWSASSGRDEEAARRQQQREIKRRLRDRASSAKRIEATLEELGGPLRQDDIDQAKGRGPGNGRGGGRGSGKSDPNGDPGFGSNGQGTQGSTASASDQRRRLSLTLRLDRLKVEIDRLQADIDVAADDETDVAADDETLVWTHDLSVKPGVTYRYRCRCSVLLYNQFFARSTPLVEAQQKLATAFTIDSLTSDWSTPVEIKPSVEFYVVSASEEGGSLGLGEAKVEIYRYFDGSHRSTQFDVQPGEQIGRTITVPGGDGAVAVDFSTDWYLAEVVADPAGSGGSGLDRDDDATVVCRRIDGTELRLRVPSRQLVNQDRIRLKVNSRR